MSSGEATPGVIHFYASNDARGLQESLTLTDIGDAVETERLSDSNATLKSDDPNASMSEASLAPR